MHLLNSYEFDAKQPPKERRPPKFMLAPLPGEARWGCVRVVESS
jgi:hypothetical protein